MNAIQKTVDYFRSAKGEMHKVSWPTRQDTIRYSGLVIGLSVTIAVFFATLDLGLTKLVDATLSLRQPAPIESQPSDIDLTPVSPDVIPTTAPADTNPAPAAVPALDIKNAQPIEIPKQ